MGDVRYKTYVTQHTKMLKDGTVKTYTVNQKYKVTGYPRKDGTRAAKMEFSPEQITEMKRLDDMGVMRTRIRKQYGITQHRLVELIGAKKKDLVAGVVG